MKNNFVKNHYMFWLGIGLTIIWLSLLTYFNLLYESRYAVYLDHRQLVFTDGIDSIINDYESFSNFIFEDIIDNQKIRGIMLAADTGDETQKDAAREALFKELNDDYQVMIKHDFRQLQFHLANGDSFLRFHTPEKYGDNLLSARESIRVVVGQHLYVTGFEEGRVFNGYRFVYPIMEGENYLGSVEVSISLASVIEGLYALESSQDYGFLLSKEVMESIVFENEQDRYQNSLVSDAYVADVEVFNLIDQSSAQPELYKDAAFISELRKSVASEIGAGESFIKELEYQGRFYLAQYQQIRDVSGEAVGYFFTIGEDSQLYDLSKTKDLSFILTTTIYFMLLLAIYYVKQRNDTIANMAIYDQLTRLYNRHSFFMLSEKVVAAAQRDEKDICIAIMDIDYFKRVNDQYGHAVGDLVLKELAQIIGSSVRSTDVLARLGGEEFILLFTESDCQSSKKVAERIRKVVENHSFEVAGKITISIGLVEKDSSESLDEAIIRADQALYLAKEKGRNQTAVKLNKKKSS